MDVAKDIDATRNRRKMCGDKLQSTIYTRYAKEQQHLIKRRGSETCTTKGDVVLMRHSRLLKCRDPDTSRKGVSAPQVTATRRASFRHGRAKDPLYAINIHYTIPDLCTTICAHRGTPRIANFQPLIPVSHNSPLNFQMLPWPSTPSPQSRLRASGPFCSPLAVSGVRDS